MPETIIRGVIVGSGLALIYLGLGFYRDENEKIQNRLEQWNLAARQAGLSLYERISLWLRGLIGLTNDVLSFLFGGSSHGIRFFALSSLYSTLSLLIGLYILAVDVGYRLHPTFLTYFWSLLFLILGLAWLCIRSRGYRALHWGIVVAMIVLPVLYCARINLIDKNTYKFTLIAYLLASLASLASDFVVIIAFRRLLIRFYSWSNPFLHMAGILAMSFIVCILTILPYYYGRLLIPGTLKVNLLLSTNLRPNDPYGGVFGETPYYPYATFARSELHSSYEITAMQQEIVDAAKSVFLLFTSLSNLIIMLPCLIFLCLLLLSLLGRLTYPLTSRLFNAFVEVGITGRKMAFSGLGLTIIGSQLPRLTSLLEPLLKFFQ